MSASAQDNILAFTEHPDACILSVSAAPSSGHAGPPGYTKFGAMAAWVLDGRISKRIYYAGERYAITKFMKDVCGNRTGHWETYLMTPVGAFCLLEIAFAPLIYTHKFCHVSLLAERDLVLAGVECGHQ